MVYFGAFLIPRQRILPCQLQEAQERNAHLEIQKKSLQRRLTASLRKSEQLVPAKPPSPAPSLEKVAAVVPQPLLPTSIKV